MASGWPSGREGGPVQGGFWDLIRVPHCCKYSDRLTLAAVTTRSLRDHRDAIDGERGAIQSLNKINLIFLGSNVNRIFEDFLKRLVLK